MGAEVDQPDAEVARPGIAGAVRGGPGQRDRRGSCTARRPPGNTWGGFAGHPPTTAYIARFDIASPMRERLPFVLSAPPARASGARRKRRTGPRRRYPWAELLRRVFLIEVLVCPRCGGPRRLLAAIQDPESIRRVLGSLGLSAVVPELAAARSPPRQGELEFEG